MVIDSDIVELQGQIKTTSLTFLGRTKILTNRANYSNKVLLQIQIVT